MSKWKLEPLLGGVIIVSLLTHKWTQHKLNILILIDLFNMTNPHHVSKYNISKTHLSKWLNILINE